MLERIGSLPGRRGLAKARPEVWLRLTPHRLEWQQHERPVLTVSFCFFCLGRPENVMLRLIRFQTRMPSRECGQFTMMGVRVTSELSPL